ncbi:MAG TPA: lipoyl(octanoyl) transferase LipB [Candidatus Acidoferrales bacterium]|nr:lipoyl(octanoyl) transferase LipB [Candidatus Acidoferrales bacterium]
MEKYLKTCLVLNAGLIAYGAACELQRRLVEARKAGEIPDALVYCEHPHVITMGRNARESNLLASKRLLAQRGVNLAQTDRGGDVTYHGPGQVVVYPILDLTDHRRDVRWYVEQLEEVMIRATTDYGIEAKRSAAGHGVWVGSSSGVKTHESPATDMSELKLRPPKNQADDSGEEKLGAIGVHLSRWVTSHGFAYNVATDLRYFDLIVPCGIQGKRATSLERVLGRSVDSGEVRERLEARFAEVFELEMVPISREKLFNAAGKVKVPGDPVYMAHAKVEIGSGA